MQKQSISMTINSHPYEYDYLILQEIENEDGRYLVLAACDEKIEAGEVGDLGMPADDIVIVKAVEREDKTTDIVTIQDTDELLKVARMVEDTFGHLSDKTMEAIEDDNR